MRYAVKMSARKIYFCIMNEENEEKGNVFAPFRPKHFKRSMPEKMAILSRTSVDIRCDINLTAPPVLACSPCYMSTIPFSTF